MKPAHHRMPRFADLEVKRTGLVRPLEDGFMRAASLQLAPLCHGPSAAQWKAAHLALKRNTPLWRSLAFQGFQHDGRGRLHEARCCPACQSTIFRPVSRPKATELYQGLLALCEQAQRSLASCLQSMSQQHRTVTT